MEYFLGECKACGQTKVVNEEAFCQDCCPTHLKADKEPVAEVPCSAGLEGLLIKAGKQLKLNAKMLRIEGFVEMAIDSEVIFAEIAVKLTEGKEYIF